MIRHSIVLSLLLITLAGCRRAPKSGQMLHDVQRNLNDNFAAGLFEVVELKRFGSQPCRVEGKREPELLVYYKAKLKVLRDVSLTDWDKLNIATLASVLGATPNGIGGIRRDGNNAGDILKVWGTIYYYQKDKQWRVTPRAPIKGAEPDEGKGEKAFAVADDALRYLNTRFSRFKQNGDSKQLRLLKNTVKQSEITLRLRLAALNNEISFVSGDKNGAYFALGQGIQKAYQTQKTPFVNVCSDGSDQNVTLVSQGLSDFGIAQNDIAYLRYKGFAKALPKGAMTNLRAVCSLYPEAVQIVVDAKSDIHSVDDLRKRRVSLGRPGSGGFINATQILKVCGVDPETDITHVSSNSMKDDIEALAAGKIDAFFTTMAYPAPLVQELASSTPLRLLSLDPEIISRLRDEYPYYVPLSIARNTYHGLKDDVKTVGVTAMIVTRADVSERAVKRLIDTLLEYNSTLFSDSANAYYISKKTMPLGLSIPPHPAAKKMFNLQVE